MGGGPLSPRLAARALGAGRPLCVSYAMSETPSQITLDCPDRADVARGRVGRPLRGVELRLDPPRSGSPRRVRVRGGHGDGGLRQSGTQIGRRTGQRLVRTGDLGMLDQQGVLHRLGRADDMPVSGGETVHPAQVEALLRNCPGVDEGPMDPLWGHSIRYRIAAGPRQGRKVFTLQILPATDEPYGDGIGEVGGLLRASCPSRSGSAFGCSKLFLAILSRCMPAWRPRLRNAAGWNGCVVASAARRHRRSGCR